MIPDLSHPTHSPALSFYRCLFCKIRFDLIKTMATMTIESEQNVFNTLPLTFSDIFALRNLN